MLCSQTLKYELTISNLTQFNGIDMFKKISVALLKRKEVNFIHVQCGGLQGFK